MRELIVDSFAGGGGASLGISWALGRGPDIAINHDAEALAMHAANHPETRHLNSNIWQVDPIDAVGRKPVGLAWFSPSCIHHSRAKGGKPLSRQDRDLAWIVVHWAKRVRPRVIALENVSEFREWTCLDADNRPCKERRGQTFDRWVSALRRGGYRVEWRDIEARDYGAPTTRTRLFLIARRDGLPIVWPEATHGPGRLPYRTTAEFIDWSIPCPPIEGRGLVPATLKRIEEGRRRFGTAPFVVKYYGSGGWQSIDEPLHTITTKDRFALVVGDGMRMFSPRELFLCQGFPETYDITTGPNGRRLSRAAQIRMCGNSVSPYPAKAVIAANYSEDQIPASRRVRPAAPLPLFETGDAA